MSGEACACSAEGPKAAERHPDLAAVVADDPLALLRATGAAAGGAASAAPCGLAPLHLAAALGRRRCVVALLDAGGPLWGMSYPA